MRDDPKVYNTDKEKLIIVPENPTYPNLAKECVQSRICVDLYMAIPLGKSIDLASMAPLANMTGGDLHYFPNYEEQKHSEKLYYSIYRMLTRTSG